MERITGMGGIFFKASNPERMAVPAETDYLGQAAFMVNYRVSNLDRLIDQLTTDGIAVDKVEEYDYGRFAWVTHPEGNRIELWEPSREQAGGS